MDKKILELIQNLKNKQGTFGLVKPTYQLNQVNEAIADQTTKVIRSGKTRILIPKN